MMKKNGGSVKPGWYGDAVDPVEKFESTGKVYCIPGARCPHCGRGAMGVKTGVISGAPRVIPEKPVPTGSGALQSRPL